MADNNPFISKIVNSKRSEDVEKIRLRRINLEEYQEKLLTTISCMENIFTMCNNSSGDIFLCATIPPENNIFASFKFTDDTDNENHIW